MFLIFHGCISEPSQHSMPAAEKNVCFQGFLVPGVRRGTVCPGVLSKKERNFDSVEIKFMKTLGEVLCGNISLNWFVPAHAVGAKKRLDVI